MVIPREQLTAFLIAVSFAAGLNLYLTVATLGLLARAGWIALPGELGLVTQWWVIGVSAALFLVEFIADKIPVFDLVWNALHTFIRVPAGAVMGYAAAAHLGPQWQFGAAALGGAMALAAHGGKTAARAAVTPSPEPISNFVLSVAEDGFTVFVTWFATRHPFIAAGVVLTIVAVIVILIRTVARALRALFAPRQRAVRE